MSLLRAAIYARTACKDSNFGNSRAIIEQIEDGICYCHEKSWIIDEDDIYIDDGFSGVNYKKNTGLMKLISCIGNYDIIVTRDGSRFSRNYELVEIISNFFSRKKRIFYYWNDEEEGTIDALSKFKKHLLELYV